MCKGERKGGGGGCREKLPNVSDLCVEQKRTAIMSCLENPLSLHTKGEGKIKLHTVSDTHDVVKKKAKLRNRLWHRKTASMEIIAECW